MKQITKVQDNYYTKLNEAKTKQDIYVVAGFVNNHPEHILVDKVTFLVFLSFEEAIMQVEKMIDELKY